MPTSDPHAGMPALNTIQLETDAAWMAARIQMSIEDINAGRTDATTVGRLHNVMALAGAYALGDPYAPSDSTGGTQERLHQAAMWLVYTDASGRRHYQPWQDLDDVGTLIDPDTGEDMPMVGWTLAHPDAAAAAR